MIFNTATQEQVNKLNSNLDNLFAYQDLTVTEINVPSKTWATANCTSYTVPDGYKFFGYCVSVVTGSIDASAVYCAVGRIATSISRVLLYNGSSSQQNCGATIKVIFIKE